MIFKIFAVIGLPQFYRAVATCIVPICCMFMFVPHALAADKQPCDCMDVKLEPSKDRIKITRSKEVNEQLRAVEKNNPTQGELLKRQVATASTFLQRHMNGDIYQDQSPDDWRDYNGPIMAMTMEEWLRMTSERGDKDFSSWAVCPRAQLKDLLSTPTGALVRYNFVAVGRSVPERLRSYNYIFSDAERGKPFSIEVIVNDQAKVTDMKQVPQARYSGPYTTAIRALKQRIGSVSATDIDQDRKRIATTSSKYSDQIDQIVKAANVCAALVTGER